MLRGQNALLFVGTYEHGIDAKQRLAIPSEIREQLDSSGDGEILYAVVMEGPTLCLYTQSGFEKRSEQLDASERSPEEVLLYEQVLYSLAQRLEIDKQGRVRLPDRLLKMAGLGKEVTLIGVKDHVEIHDREAWQEKLRKVLEERPDLLMNPRRAMRAQTQEPG